MYRLLRLAAVAFSMALFSSTAGAQSVQVLLPRDKTIVADRSLVITGRAPRGTSVAWSLENRAGKEADQVRADWGDLFEVFVLLQPGLNRIKVGSQPLEVFLDRGEEPLPKGFSRQRVHAGDVSRCEDCHDSLDMRLIEGGYPGVCLSCHVVVSANPANPGEAVRDPHFVKAVANCGRCHEAHASHDPKLLVGTAQDLCTKCHQGEVPPKTVHPAYEEGGCIACHDPHYSGFEDLLHDAQPGVCQVCHDQGLERSQLHSPLATGQSCATCHDAHGSGSGLPKSGGEGCVACHEPVRAQGHGEDLGECESCHDPHGRIGSGMLRQAVEELCAECHEGIGEGETVHPALDEGCETCHDPHRDDDNERAKESCGECHATEAGTELAGLHGNLDIPASACVGCHPPHAADMERLVRGNLHYPLTEGECSACHGGGIERSVVIDDPARRCRMCHGFENDMKAKGEQVHDPVADGDCTACHDPHMSRRRVLLRGSELEVCGTCHEQGQLGGGQERHPPAEACTDCHGAHGGKGRYFLSASPPALCAECHEDPRDGLEELHPALEEGCLACHDPHAGFVPGYLAGDSSYAVCGECHDVPVLGDGRELHTPAATCTECHDPHGGTGPRYLPAQPPELCFSCHDDPGEAAGEVHLALDEGCLACHDPHTGFSGAALQAPVRDLCLECHDDPAAGREHVHAPAAADCAGCHDPHVSPNPALLRATGTALCRTCHQFDEDKAGRALHDPAEDCAECHESGHHGGDHAKFLPESPPSLCLNCHDDPTTGEGDLHPALDEGCLVCHSPHAGFRRGLLRGTSVKEVCLECHDDPVGGRKIVHAALAEGCSTCHDPHTSPNPQFLRAAGYALCQGCHDAKTHRHDLDAEKGRRYPGAAAFPVDAGRYACVGCHLPHASDEPKLYPGPAATFCSKCHQI